jgi:hypothetical protein
VNRIYPDEIGILYEHADWRLCDGPYVQHLPTSGMFRIGCDEGAIARGSARLTDFYAEPAHLCKGLRCPAESGLTFLGQGAIAFYLQEIGVWKPDLIAADIDECPGCKQPWHEGHRCDLEKTAAEDIPF